MINNKLTGEQMDLDTAISHADERATALSGPCAAQHAQLASWLRELQEHRKAQPVEVTFAMAYAFHHALTDSPLGSDEAEEIKTGLRAALANVTATQPAPVVPTFDEWLEIRGNKPLGWVKDAMRESYDACRAAMLQGGNSPVRESVANLEREEKNAKARLRSARTSILFAENDLKNTEQEVKNG